MSKDTSVVCEVPSLTVEVRGGNGPATEVRAEILSTPPEFELGYFYFGDDGRTSVLVFGEPEADGDSVWATACGGPHCQDTKTGAFKVGLSW